MSELTMMANTPNTIALGDKIFRLSSPTLNDLAEAESFSKELKQNRRKEYIKQYLELFSQLPKEMSLDDKKQIINNILPPELTPKDKIELLASMPDSWDDDRKNKQLMKFVMERDGIEWTETLYILWLCINKNHPDIKLDDIKKWTTSNDLENILKAISPNKVGGSEKNV